MLGGGARLVVESGPSLLRTLVRESHGLLLGSYILKMNTLRLREFKQLAQGHTARKTQSKGLNSIPCSYPQWTVSLYVNLGLRIKIKLLEFPLWLSGNKSN